MTGSETLTALSGAAMGIVAAVPPGPAGVIILRRALGGERAAAARATAAFFAAELLALLLAAAFLERAAWLARLAWMKPAAGVYLVAFAVSTWRAASAAQADTNASAFGVFRLTLFNPALWMGAVSILALARASGGDGVGARVLFVVAFELGSIAWYVALILSARIVPGAARRHVERAAVLAVGAIGVWLIASVV